jgi:hypothetical protein
MGDISKDPKTRKSRTISAAATLEPTDAGIIYVANTASMTVTLPPASAGLEFTFMKTTSAANAVTIDGYSTELVNGAANYASIDAQYDCATVASNGSAWFITSAKIA